MASKKYGETLKRVKAKINGEIELKIEFDTFKGLNGNTYQDEDLLIKEFMGKKFISDKQKKEKLTYLVGHLTGRNIVAKIYKPQFNKQDLELAVKTVLNSYPN